MKNAKTFLSSLQNHAHLSMGDKRIDAITADDISIVLAPIWTTKPDMARKVRQRIGTVLNFAHGKGWRPTEAPGKSVTVGLPRQPQGGNYSAMPEVPDPVAEAALAHTVPDKVVRAYKRTNFLEMRRTLLDAWGAFVRPENSNA